MNITKGGKKRYLKLKVERNDKGKKPNKKRGRKER